MEPHGTPDPITATLEASPFDSAGLPGPRQLGFLACSAVVRVDAFHAVGGFSELLWFGAEEKLLSMDLTAAGWAICYIADALAHHMSSTRRPPPRWRRAIEQRNELLICLMRRPPMSLLRRMARLARAAPSDPVARSALAGFLRRAPAAYRLRRRLPASVEAMAAAFERPHLTEAKNP